MEMERFSNDEVDQVLSHLFSGLSVFHAEICEWLLEADQRQQFLADGSPDLVRWVSARFGVRHSTAGRLVRVAKGLQDLPILRSRFASGELSLDETDAISRMATADNEEELIEESLGLSTAALDRAARRAHPPTVEDEGEMWRRRALYIQKTLDGLEGKLTANLPGAELQIVENAIRDRADRIPVNPETGMFDPYPARLADGLVEVCATTGDENHAGARVQVTVHADLDALTSDSATTGVAELETGPVLANETARRLSCDGIVECSVYDQGRLLGVGRRSRVIPGWLRRQLWYRDGGCVFPGCGRKGWVHAHHKQHWADGGATDLGNLILLCGYHHRFCHEHGWTIEDDDRGRPVFTRPDGSIYPPVRPPLHPRLKALVGQRT